MDEIPLHKRQFITPDSDSSDSENEKKKFFEELGSDVDYSISDDEEFDDKIYTLSVLDAIDISDIDGVGRSGVAGGVGEVSGNDTDQLEKKGETEDVNSIYDSYSMSFESATDLHDQKPMTETDLTTDLSIQKPIQLDSESVGVNEKVASNNDLDVAKDPLANEDEFPSQVVADLGNDKSNAVSDSEIVDIRAKDDDPVNEDISKDNAAEAVSVMDAYTEDVPGSTLVTTSTIEKDQIQLEDPITLVRPKDNSPFLTFSDLMALNEKEETQPLPESKIPKVKVKQTRITTGLKKSGNQVKEVKDPVKVVKKNVLKKVNEKALALSPQKVSSVKVVEAKQIGVIEQKSLKPKLPENKEITPAVQESKPKPQAASQVTAKAVDQARDKNVQWLETTIDTLNSKLKEADLENKKLKDTLSNSTKTQSEQNSEIDRLLQQIKFLESRLDEELELKRPVTVNHPDSESIQKTISEQENLIRGYQTENEKLLLKIKDLKSLAIESDQRHFLKITSLTKENATLKTQLEMLDNEKSRSEKHFSNTIDKVKVEELEAKLAMLDHQLKVQEEDNRKMVAMYEAQIADKEKRINELAAADPEALKELQEKYGEEQQKAQAYILELESKLEWHLSNQEAFKEAESRIHRLEEANAEFNQLLSTENQNPNLSKTDQYKIKALESQLRDLQQELQYKSRDLEVDTETKRPNIPTQETIKILKKRIYALENEKLDIRKSFQDQSVTIQNLVGEKEKLAGVVESLKKEKDEMKQRIQELESLPAIDTKKWVLRAAVDELLKKVKQQETKLKSKIAELDKALQQQIYLNAQTKNENNNAINTLNTLLRQKDLENADLQQRLQTQTEVKYDVVHQDLLAARKSLQTVQSENETLKLRIELLESSKHTMHATTMEILKQTQMESSKLAFVYSKNTVDMLKRDWQKEVESKLTISKKKYKEKINELEKKLVESKKGSNSPELEFCVTRLKSLAKKYQELDGLYTEWEKIQSLINTGVEPSSSDLDLLLHQMDTLERKIHPQTQPFAVNDSRYLSLQKEYSEYQKRMNGKILEFQGEIESLLKTISVLKSQVD